MLTNQKIKFIRSLSLKKNRIENQLFVVEGEKNVNEFINSGFLIEIESTWIFVATNV